MKIIKIILFSVLICGFAQNALSDVYKEGVIYRTQQVENKPAIEQPEILINKAAKKKRKSRSLFINTREINKSNKTLKKRALINRRRKLNKINSTTSITPLSFSKKKSIKIKAKTNRFEDKNGDGVNDTVKDSKL